MPDPKPRRPLRSHISRVLSAYVISWTRRALDNPLPSKLGGEDDMKLPRQVPHRWSITLYDRQISEAVRRLEKNIDPLVKEGRLEDAMYRAGRNESVELLKQWWASGILDYLGSAELGDLVSMAWVGADVPTRRLSTRNWLNLFKTTGFITDRQEITRPVSDLWVYRGCIPWQWRRLAWTTDRDQAHWFAEWGADRGHPGVVYSAVVPSRHVLARFQERQENEVVVNPYGLKDLQLIGAALENHRTPLWLG